MHKDHAKQIDAILESIHLQLAEPMSRINSIYDSLHRYVGDRQTQGRRREWLMSRRLVLQATDELIAAGVSRRVDDAKRCLEKLAEAEAIRAKLNEQIDGFDAVYAADPWPRFFLVTDGHIHSSPHCHTLRPTTQLGWLPKLSGETEKDAVDAHGTILCTHCYPSAPVEWTVGLTKPEDDTKCSSQNWDREKMRNSYPSYTAPCKDCGAAVSISPSTLRARKHKRGDL